jgi:C4-dicarboxylate-specific signal transduction histidine kinase
MKDYSQMDQTPLQEIDIHAGIVGTLAAGLAHELNNPAAAGRRAVGQLRSTFQELQPLIQIH